MEIRYGDGMKPPAKSFPKSKTASPFAKRGAFGRPTFDRKPAPSAAPLNESEKKLQFDPENDLIYGAHPVAAAVANPKRKLVKLWATENGWKLRSGPLVLQINRRYGDAYTNS